MSSTAYAVAIVGIGGFFPEAAGASALWDLILQRRSTATEPPEGRWIRSVEALYSPEVGRQDHLFSRKACFLQHTPQPNPDTLNLPEGFLERLDPAIHLLLSAGQQAIADVEGQSINGERCGIVLGNLALPSESSSAIARETLGRAFEAQLLGDRLQTSVIDGETDPINRLVAGLPAGILAHTLGFTAGHYTLDAACASSLYALKLACDQLTSGRVDAMLAGGISRPDSLYTQMGFSQLRALSPNGTCSPFDQAGNGLVVGEGAGLFVLRRLEDAVASGDRIYGVIRGVGLSNDIGGSLLAPMSEGQARAMQAAYKQAGWQPSDVDLIECHATGTPVGDAVEFNSLQQLWADATSEADRCVIGSVKSNIGHLLTAAGSAALCKVLMALKEETLPPTANFSSPSAKINLHDSPFRILSKAEPWPEPGNQRPRRAAVSAFGFGGINAHLLVESYQPVNTQSQPQQLELASPKPEPIAIVGMATRLGEKRAIPSELLEDLPQTDFSTAPYNWGVSASPQGLYTHNVQIPHGRFRIPPKEMEDMLPQQALMLATAADALNEKALSDSARQRTGVFTGIAFDMAATGYNVRWAIPAFADKWAKALDTIASPEWIDRLCDAAHAPLTANRVMGSLGNIVASRIAREFDLGGPSFTLSSEETSGLHALDVAISSLQRGEIDQALACAVDLPGDPRSLDSSTEAPPVTEGATALILKRLCDARAEGDQIYAVLEGVDWKSTTLYAASNQSQNPPLRQAPEIRLSTGETTGQQWASQAGAHTGLLALARATVAIDRRQIPDNVGSFWLADRNQLPRRCQIEAHSIDGNRCRIKLRQTLSDEHASVTAAHRWPSKLFVLSGNAPDELLKASQRLMTLLDTTSSLTELATAWVRTGSYTPANKLFAALVTCNTEQLVQQLELLQQHLSTSPDKPLGDKATLLPAFARDQIFYRPAPLAKTGEVAFVYPGMGNPYPGMGQALSGLFPSIFERQQTENLMLREQYQTDVFWQDELNRKDQNALVIGQVALGTAVTDMLQACGVEPKAAIGYSLGESTSLFALRAWHDRDGMLQRLKESSLFVSDLAGPCLAAHRRWQLDANESVHWRLGVIDQPAEQVASALADLPQAYLLIINTADECVIGGDAGQIEKVLHRLNGNFFELDGVSTVHCDVVEEVADAYRQLHSFPTTPPNGIRFYSGAIGTHYPLTEEAAADAILTQACQTVDFTRVVQNAYQDGVRLFVEIGPGNSCSRMIGSILDDKPHMTRTACWPGLDESETFIRLIAELAAEGVPVDPSFCTAEGMNISTDDTSQVTIKRPGVHIQSITEPMKPQASAAAVDPTPTVRTNSPQTAPSISTTANPTAPNGLEMIQQASAAATEAHGTFLQLMDQLQAGMAAQLQLQQQLITNARQGQPIQMPSPLPEVEPVSSQPISPKTKEVLFGRDLCMEFAIGSVAKMLGPEFAEVDTFPTRVRLPDEPLQLVDRILQIEGEAKSMGSGRVVTEHDVRPGAWYLDAERAPTCISVEAGQADLFLSGYLGIDFQHRGEAVYRLLDAVVTFHRDLPRVGETIHYDIHIDHFFRQGDTWLFRFWFDGTIDGEPFITMRKGCAGFFSEGELAAGKGIVHTKLDLMEKAGKTPQGHQPLLPIKMESYNDAQLDDLRNGNLAACFGVPFADLPIQHPLTLPGGQMKLVDRILELNPAGGRFGLGQIRGEADITPDDWFLTCHFCDDHVMPGTLMYECCQHTMRILLMRMGWVAESDRALWQPVPGVGNQLKCRGQVIETTKKVEYRITLKEIGFRPEPFAIADALMFADGKPIVEVINLSVMLTGTDLPKLQQLWQEQTTAGVGPKPAIFDTDRITAFAIGKPSEAFGDQYRVFDKERKIARLPGPPFQFLDRITEIHTEPWVLKAGGTIEAQYDVPVDAWYFEANRQSEMPFCVLLETALQPCGWLAAYLGSALSSETDLSFRNLDGKAIQHRPITPQSGTLTTEVKITRVAQSGGMIIQAFDFRLSDQQGPLYTGDTVFGFFTADALANQVGLREITPWQPDEDTVASKAGFLYPADGPYPREKMRMIDRIELLLPEGGPGGHGFVRGTMKVDPDRWFFKAHFYEDPVIPGSLGLESFLQLLKVYACRRWGAAEDSHFETIALGYEHKWSYRGQVIPSNTEVTVDAAITAIDDEQQLITADGYLHVDGKTIYEMKDFTLKLK